MTDFSSLSARLREAYHALNAASNSLYFLERAGQSDTCGECVAYNRVKSAAASMPAIIAEVEALESTHTDGRRLPSSGWQEHFDTVPHFPGKDMGVDLDASSCPNCGESRYWNKGVCLACTPSKCSSCRIGVLGGHTCPVDLSPHKEQRMVSEEEITDEAFERLSVVIGGRNGELDASGKRIVRTTLWVLRAAGYGIYKKDSL